MLLSLNPPCSYLPKKTDPAYLYLLENGKSRTAFQDQTTVHPAHLIFIYHIPTPQASIVLGFPGSSAGKKKKNLPAVQETPVQFLGQEDPLEKGWAAHSSILGLPWCLRW